MSPLAAIFLWPLASLYGNTRGIGLAIAELVLARGGAVAINGRESTAEAAALLDRHGPGRVAVELADAADPAQAAGMVERAAARFGRLDMLAHSTGGPAPGTILDLTAEGWMQAFAIHVHPVFHLFRAAHPHLAREGGAVLAVDGGMSMRITG